MKKNIFEGIDNNRLERALGVLFSSTLDVEVKVTLTPKKQEEKELAATSSKKNKWMNVLKIKNLKQCPLIKRQLNYRLFV